MRQVFVFSERGPCGPDLASLLHPEGELDALGWETNLDRAIRRLKEIQPPTVIVVGQDAAIDCRPAVIRIETECPGIQIAEVNLETRVVRISGGVDLILQELKDLLSAVERLSAVLGSRLPAGDKTS
jgi:hypothetical protein